VQLQDTPLRVGLSADARGYSAAERLDAGKPTPTEKRRSGRTHRMIMGLPKGGSVVVVHSPSMIGVFRDLIRDLRGDDVASNTRVVAAPSVADERTMLRGISLPVFRDHFVDEQREHARAVMQAWRL
jgi:hypothetical protein